MNTPQRQQKRGRARTAAGRVRKRVSARKARRRPKGRRRKATLAETPSLTTRLETATRWIFKAQSIVACCRLACASLYDSEHSQEEMVFALEASVDLLGNAADEIEAIEDEHPRDDDPDSEARP